MKNHVQKIKMTDSFIENIEIIKNIFKNNNIEINIIHSPFLPKGNGIWYNQDDVEFAFLLKGNAVLEFENNERVKLHSGEFLKIEKNEIHRLAFTSEKPTCTWLTIHIKTNI